MNTLSVVMSAESMQAATPSAGVDVVGDSTVTVEAGTTPTPEPTAEPTASPTPGSISATRSFDAFDETLVAPGEQVEVRITAQGHGTFADVVETLPAGFTYVSSSGLLAEDVSVSGQVATGQVVTFTLFSTPSPTTFTYTVDVTAASADGENPFSGDFSGVDANNDPFSGVQVGGDSIVTVEDDAAIRATRSFDATVAPGEQVEVRITARGHGTFADVVETLPAGFTYVSSSLDAADVSVSGHVVTLTLFGTTSPTTFTYTVTAGTAGSRSFSGVFSGVDANNDPFSPVEVRGDSSIRVRGSAPAPAVRRWRGDRYQPAA